MLLESELEQLYRIEEQNTAENCVSSTPFDIAAQILGLPDNPEGLVIADLAAGTSPVVAHLLQNRADAYAIDSVFSDPLEVIERKAIEILDQQSSYAPFGFRRAMFEFGAQAIAEFTESYRKNPTKYRAGFLTRTGLPDNFADWTTSLNGLMTISDNPKLMLAALVEAHRITKLGGRIVVSPVHLGYDYGDYLTIQHAEVIKEARRLGRIEIEEGITPVSTIPTGIWNRLTIFKD